MKKTYSIYIDESLVTTAREKIKQSNEFRNISELVEDLLTKYFTQTLNVQEENNKMKFDARDSKNNTETILQILTAMAEHDGVLISKHYEELTSYKVAKTYVSDSYNKKKMNTERTVKEESSFISDEQKKNASLSDFNDFDLYS